MRIRKMREEDVGQAVRLIYNIMGPLDAKKAYVDIKIALGEKKECYRFEDFFVMEIDNNVIGVGEIWALNYDPAGHLGWFVVDEKYQRKGMGSMLLRHCEEVLKKKGVKILLAETSGGNNYRAAVGFYMHNGFKIIAEIPHYWEDDTSCMYFFKRLER